MKCIGSWQRTILRRMRMNLAELIRRQDELERRVAALECGDGNPVAGGVIRCKFDRRCFALEDFSYVTLRGKNWGPFRGKQARVMKALWHMFTGATGSF